MGAVNIACRDMAEGDDKLKPFGGRHVVIFGDLLQLPPVKERACMFNSTIYFTPTRL